jgi:hypothetical protein
VDVRLADALIALPDHIDLGRERAEQAYKSECVHFDLPRMWRFGFGGPGGGSCRPGGAALQHVTAVSDIA